MATRRATALFFSKEVSQNLDRQKAVRVARPLVKHELLVSGCLAMAETATFDECYKAWLRLLLCNHKYRRRERDGVATGEFSIIVCCPDGRVFATDL